MRLKLDKVGTDSSKLSAMRSGDIAVIRKWTYHSAVGTVVQRHGDALIALGQSLEYSWNDIFAGLNKEELDQNCEIQILPPGSTFTLE